MDSESIISVEQFCRYYDVPVSFISALKNYGLIEITIVKQIECIGTSQIKNIEKMMRLHYELNINLEGIDAIYNLLKQNEALQNEIMRLQNKINFYENF